MSKTGQRSLLNYNPIYGNLAGWTIADLDPAIATSVNVLNNVNTDTTSAAVNLNANGCQVLCQFSDAVTTCTIQLIDSTTSTVLETWTRISNFYKDHLYFTYYHTQTLLQGDAIKVRAFNFTGTGTVYVDVVASN